MHKAGTKHIYEVETIVEIYSKNIQDVINLISEFELAVVLCGELVKWLMPVCYWLAASPADYRLVAKQMLYMYRYLY